MTRIIIVAAALVLIAAATYLWASRGPRSLRAELTTRLTRPLPRSDRALGPVLTDDEVARLPPPVARYVRASGAVGKPRIRAFRAEWRGRIRFDADTPWMALTAVQRNVVDPSERTFFLDATMKGLPVDVLHVFDARGATMRAKVLSLFTVVDGRGPEMDRGETVTVLNDLVLLAPGALTHPSLRWTPIDDRSAKVRYTLRSNEVEATLLFDEAGELVDFVSDDRLRASQDGSSFTRVRWSTPLAGHRVVGPARVATKGAAVWHLERGAFTYAELELVSLSYETDPEINAGA
ncbi:hypothetical protein L6R52_28350 [Myxococcota bacterium]|nr:hypothetical protein [Myxococcota bacterium]